MKFDNADAFQIEHMFLNFYLHDPDTNNKIDDANSSLNPSEDYSFDMISRYAAEMALCIPGGAGGVTPAELQAYFTKHRDSHPEVVLANVDDFLRDVAEERRHAVEESAAARVKGGAVNAFAKSVKVLDEEAQKMVNEAAAYRKRRKTQRRQRQNK